MQSAENLVFGQTLRGRPAAAMLSAATTNERMGAVVHDQATDATAVQGVTVSETRIPGGRVVADQAIGQYLAQDDDAGATAGGGRAGAGARGASAAVVAEKDMTKVTIGEVLEATALAAGDAPVERSNAAAIQAAEACATGLDANVPGGLAAQAQSAAADNAWAWRDEDKATLGDVLANATARLVADKPVESADALGVAGVENRNRDDAGDTARPGGVAASMAAAARLNREEAVWE